jgi:hypothetical protein
MFEKKVLWGGAMWAKVILARCEPGQKYELYVVSHNELWPPQSEVAESPLRNFNNVLTSSARRKGGWPGK